MTDKTLQSEKTASNFLTLKNDPSAPALLAYEVRNAEGAESEQIIEQRSQYIKKKLDSLTEEQQTRFEFFMRSHFPKNRIKEIMNEALGPKQLVTDEMVIVVSGLAKLFVGEICDLAMSVKNEKGGKDGILPEYIQEAHRRMQNEGRLGHRPDHHYFLSPDSLFSFKESFFDCDESYAFAMQEALKSSQNNSSSGSNSVNQANELEEQEDEENQGGEAEEEENEEEDDAGARKRQRRT